MKAESKPKPKEGARKVLPITNQKLWAMAKVITNKQKAAKEQRLTGSVDWNMLEEMWFDWLEEELIEPENEKG